MKIKDVEKIKNPRRVYGDVPFVFNRNMVESLRRTLNHNAEVLDDLIEAVHDLAEEMLKKETEA